MKVVQVLEPARTGNMVYSVDDLWFSSIRGSKNSVHLCLHYALNERIDLNAMAGMIANAKKEPLAPIVELDLLSHLVELCDRAGFGLRLCDFEYFEEHFASEINTRQNALLLDIQNSAARTESAAHYGITKLQQLLGAKRPHADISFVTAYPGTAEQIIHRKNEPGWWLLLSIPFVQKGANLREDLGSFFQYFREGRSLEPVSQMARYLLENERSHPETIADAVANPVPLAHAYQEVESFKAIYFWDSTSDNWRPQYPLRVGMFIAHLIHFGFPARYSAGDSREVTYLPIQPGGVFLLLLADFLSFLQLSGPVVLTIANGNCQLNIPVAGEGSSCLKSRLYGTEGGEATRRLRALLTCRSDSIPSLAKLNHLKPSWRSPENVPECSPRTHRLLVEPTFSSQSIELTWAEQT